MLKLIETVPADGKIMVRVPKEMGKKVEIIIRTVQEKPGIEQAKHMKMQEKSGFVREVLAAPEEDVWNDL